MNSRIVYAKSRDGTRVASSVQGSGFPMMYLQRPVDANCVMARGPLFDSLMSGRTLLTVDLRGCGQAEWHPDSHTFEDYFDDIHALMAATGFRQVDLMASCTRAPVAVQFAARYPSSVRRLFIQGVTSGPTAACGRALCSASSRVLIQQDWELYRQISAARGFGEDQVVERAARIKQCVDQESLLATFAACDAVDVSNDPVLLRHPTFLWEIAGNTLIDIGEAEKFAAAAGLDLCLVPYRPNFGYLAVLYEAIERFDATQDAASGGDCSLTTRESEVLSLVATGLRNHEIAQALTVARSTVDRHLAHIYDKTGVRNRAEATRWAIAHALVPAAIST